MSWADDMFEGATDAAVWLRGVLLGEWEDNKSLSQCVTDALAGFTPGVGNILAFRDLMAIIFRLAKYPEKREKVEEWILLIAMLLPLALTIGGAAIAGVGALVGAELGAFFRALIMLLIKQGGVGLKAVVEFFQHHGYGDVVGALRGVKFSKYAHIVNTALTKQITKLTTLIRDLQAKLRELTKLPDWLPGHEAAQDAVIKLDRWLTLLSALQRKSTEMLPKALRELDGRLGHLLAGDVKAAVRSTHTVTAGVKADKVARAKAVDNGAQPGMRATKISGDPQPGNVRRMKERRLLSVPVKKHGQEFRFTNGEGLPVGAKPYEEGVTKVDHPKLSDRDWEKHADAVKEGYPDLSVNPHTGKADSQYDTFADLTKADFKPGDKIVRVVEHDGKDYTDNGAFWTRQLPVDGRELRAESAVKEKWNKDGSYVAMTVPPKSDAAAWKELGYDPSAPDFNPTIKGWEGTASSQVYEFKDPATGKTLKDTFYLPGGGQQLYMDPKQMEILKKRGYITTREPTNFKDYDPDIVNTDGSKGNIVPVDAPILENVPLDQALLRASKP